MVIGKKEKSEWLWGAVANTRNFPFISHGWGEGEGRQETRVWKKKRFQPSSQKLISTTHTTTATQQRGHRRIFASKGGKVKSLFLGKLRFAIFDVEMTKKNSRSIVGCSDTAYFMMLEGKTKIFLPALNKCQKKRVEKFSALKWL